jgi:predicted transcriptional regulator
MRFRAISVLSYGFLLQNHNNKEISSSLKIPFSTIQRKVRNLIGNEFIISKLDHIYKKFGYKQGLVHIYLNNGNLEDILEKVSMMSDIISLDVHIVNSNILAGVVYKKVRSFWELSHLLRK